MTRNLHNEFIDYERQRIPDKTYYYLKIHLKNKTKNAYHRLIHFICFAYVCVSLFLVNSNKKHFMILDSLSNNHFID